MNNTNAVRPVDERGFRSLMAAFPSGVAVVTTVAAGGDPLGLTCSSLCGVSLDPPLLLVCLTRRSRTLAALTALGVFAVNMLHRGGKRTAQALATGGDDRFGTVRWTPSRRAGLPRLEDDAHAIAECRVRTTEVAGDHTIVIGEVLCVDRLTTEAPLLYGLRQYAVWPGGGHAGRADVMEETG